jgi:uncharacterized protein YkwD
MDLSLPSLARALAALALCATPWAAASGPEPRPERMAVPAVPAGSADGGDEASIVTLVNDYRARQGLDRWQPDDGLRALARAASDAMARVGQASHDGFRDRFERSGADLCVENVVRGRLTPELALALWRRSASHHRNLLEPRARWVGIATIDGYTTLLACDRPAAPGLLLAAS